MAYTTPLKVFRSMNRIERHLQEESSVSGGDTIVLDADFIVKDAYPNEGKTAIVTVGGNVQSSSDYSIDFEKNELTYSGADSGDAEIQYKSAPYSSNEVDRRISSVEEEIDRRTNTTFDGLTTVTDELYDGGGAMQKSYIFVNRPVRNISKVAVNEPDASTGNPNYVTKTEGLNEDYLEYQELGIRFADVDVAPDGEPEELKVTYDYGFSGVPADVEELATLMVVDDLVNGTVSGAMVDGRDNFDPQTVNVNQPEIDSVLSGYKVQRVNTEADLAVKGSTS